MPSLVPYLSPPSKISTMSIPARPRLAWAWLGVIVGILGFLWKVQCQYCEVGKSQVASTIVWSPYALYDSVVTQSFVMQTVNSLIIISINPNTATSAVMGISRLNLDSGNFDWNKSAPLQFAYHGSDITEDERFVYSLGYYYSGGSLGDIEIFKIGIPLLIPRHFKWRCKQNS
ncbi:unnamed protein product [Moneuplotes crassus]|uniref:Uncharacterized protein n=1 Tax=Euplotes crassus TaxID=5936 RepID=A0AAD1XBJ2_EUPCR|nr:unnamed protein product [Moneuplotes crassus]